MTALSISYASKWYTKVELYVDQIAAPFFKELACNIQITKFKEDAEIWMRSKIEVMQTQKEPFIHIDNDIFFKQKIDFNLSDVIVERRDVARYNYTALISFFKRKSEGLSYWTTNLKTIPSCGIVGFSNMDIKDEFIANFMGFESVLLEHRVSYKSFIKDYWEAGNRLEICLLLEQYNLGCLIQEKKANVTYLLAGVTEQQQSKAANSIGFTHLYGTSKYNSKVKKRIHYLFETEFTEVYKRLSRKIAQSKKLKSI